MLIAAAWPARAQQPPAQEVQHSDTLDVIAEKHYKRAGHVEVLRGDTSIYADFAEFFEAENRAVFSGNVLFTQGQNRISADRAEFNTQTNLGTFYNASGMASVKPPRQQARSGIAAPQRVGSEETDVYFFGDTIEKVGPKKYRITNGGFSTCVQPTPRWDLQAGTVILNVGHYTVLKNAVMRAKGVPLLYIPLMAYPTKKEERATGFLIPTYGSSTLRGQQFHNAFFWAINRSQDATIMHEYSSKLGQGVSGEYRYNFGGGSEGYMTTNFLDQHAASYLLSDGRTSLTSASRSFNLRGSANQLLPFGLRARARIDYFSSLTQSQTYNTDIYNASLNNRSYGGNLVGAWGSYSLNATYDHNEYFQSTTSSGITGGAPRVALTRNERPILGSPIYFSVTSEYARLLYEQKGVDGLGNPTDVNNGVTRLDVTPMIRYPFKKWQWFTVNSTFSWRDTYYTRSLLATPGTTTTTVVDDPLNRRFYTAQAQIVGPVFNRIWDTPDNGYAEKFKHSIEPNFSVQRTSAIDNYSRIVKIDSFDYVIGGTTRIDYGLTNRFFAKRKQGAIAASREIFDIDLTQSYYTDPAASQFDPRYGTSFSGAAASHYSPIQLSIRAVPADRLNGTVRAEFDSKYHTLRTIAASGSYNTSTMQNSFSWSKSATIDPVLGDPLNGFRVPGSVSQAINNSTNVHTRDNKYGGLYSFNYDVVRKTLLQQRISGYYNAQCCGLAFEYQTYNYSGLGSLVPIAADRRFFLSFTLAGLGNFSPFNGAMSGTR
jgi:LPS-assembly protein